MSKKRRRKEIHVKPRPTLTCLECGHRGSRDTVKSPCPMCGRKATANSTV